MSRIRLVCASIVILAATLACISTGNFDTLPRHEQDLFRRCWEPIRVVSCGHDTDAMFLANCQRSAAADYAAEQDENGRRLFLAGRGCPPSMISPEAYVAPAPPPVQPQPAPPPASPPPPAQAPATPDAI